MAEKSESVSAFQLIGKGYFILIFLTTFFYFIKLHCIFIDFILVTCY
jgi:hypothetical protein